MFRHALKLIWNRRRANRLVVVEIAAAFVVCFVLIAMGVNLWTNYRRPLGFDYEDVWSVGLTDSTAGQGLSFDQMPSHSVIQDAVLDALRSLPRAETVEPMLVAPYTNFMWQSDYAGDGERQLLALVNRATTDGLQAIGVDLVAGRWFGPEDEGQDYRPVLVNRSFVERAFGPNADPIGKRIDSADPGFPLDELSEEQRREAEREVRIVGVVEDFRQSGEFAGPTPYVINRMETRDATGPRFGLILKVAPGTDAGFEEDIVAAVESVAPGWVATVEPWPQLRETQHRRTLLPLKIAATVSVFFLALVVMGLIGVLWQDVVRRTQEIGLRRALGARAGDVRRQIQLEILIVGTIGILIGAVIAIQFPLLELIGRLNWASSLPGIALAGALILALVMLGALYPSWLASRREPADALRYE